MWSDSMITVCSFIRLWEEALRNGETGKAQSIRYEITRMMRDLEKEKRHELMRRKEKEYKPLFDHVPIIIGEPGE
jgi:hypothetical protein